MPPPGGVQLLRNVKEGKLAEIENMLSSGAAEVNFQNHYGDSALILACWYGHVEIARSLIEAKVRPACPQARLSTAPCPTPHAPRPTPHARRTWTW